MCVHEKERQIDKESEKENKKETSRSGVQQSDPSGQNPSCCGSNKVAMDTALVLLTSVRLCMLES